MHWFCLIYCELRCHAHFSFLFASLPLYFFDSSYQGGGCFQQCCHPVMAFITSTIYTSATAVRCWMIGWGGVLGGGEKEKKM